MSIGRFPDCRSGFAADGPERSRAAWDAAWSRFGRWGRSGGRPSAPIRRPAPICRNQWWDAAERELRLAIGLEPRAPRSPRPPATAGRSRSGTTGLRSTWPQHGRATSSTPMSNGSTRGCCSAATSPATASAPATCCRGHRDLQRPGHAEVRRDDRCAARRDDLMLLSGAMVDSAARGVRAVLRVTRKGPLLDRRTRNGSAHRERPGRADRSPASA